MHIGAGRRLAMLAAAALAGVIAASGVVATPAGAAAPPQAAAQQDLSYDYNYTTGMTWPQTQLQTPKSVMTEVGTNFWRYFPFSSNCTSLPAVGGKCVLYAIGGISQNPVKVVARTSTSFTFISLPGHFEGADRLITFTFYKTGSDPFGDIRMRVNASGPWTLNAYLTIQSGQAYAIWNTFAVNVGRAYS